MSPREEITLRLPKAAGQQCWKEIQEGKSILDTWHLLGSNFVLGGHILFARYNEHDFGATCEIWTKELRIVLQFSEDVKPPDPCID
jgi:hypothetical protein